MTVFKTIIMCFLFLTVSVNATRIYISDGPIQRIGARIYKRELLTDKFEFPKELAYDSSSRNLYFMYMDDKIQNSGRAFVNILTKKATKIKGIEKNKAIAVDTEAGEVYFGTEDGLYKFQPIYNAAFNIGLYNVNIFKLVIRNNEMYLIDANDHMLYKVHDVGNFYYTTRVGNIKTVMEFDVDYQKNIHFVTMCGLYCAVKGQEIVKNKDLNFVYNFLIDQEKTFGLSNDGLYEIDCVNGTAAKVADLDFEPRSIVFGDYGDIFYSAGNKIYRLKPVSSYLVYTLRNNNNTISYIPK